MSGLFARIRNARQKNAEAHAAPAPVVLAVPAPEPAPAAPALEPVAAPPPEPAPEPVPPTPEPLPIIAEPISTPDPEPLAYVLNPPLPSQRHVEAANEEGPAPAPRRGPRIVNVQPRIKRARTKSARKATAMKNPQPIYARIATSNGNGRTHGHHDDLLSLPGAASKHPDPEAALTWVQFLAKEVHPGALHLLLSYYRRLGWIPSGAYGWLRDLAQGIARQTTRVTWESLRISPDKLVNIHAKSYRWLQALFPAPKPTLVAMTNGHVVHVTKVARRR